MRVAIAGAGAVGRSIAQSLLAGGHRILLIEEKRSHYRPELVPQADWMLADACAPDTLQAAGIHLCDVVVAATGDDQANLVFSLQAKTQYDVPRVVARVNDPDNAWLFTVAWGVDVAVSTPGTLVTSVEEAITVGDLVRLTGLPGGGGDIVEMTLAAEGTVVGMTVADLKLPDGAALLAVVRDRNLITLEPHQRLEAADEIIMLASADVEEQIRTALRGDVNRSITPLQ
jgi:trk system potassium uptake protein